MVEIHQRFTDRLRLNFVAVKTSRHTAKTQLAHEVGMLCVRSFQLLNQLTDFPETSCKIITLVDRPIFLTSSNQQSAIIHDRH
jgi:hypothetical protein